MSSQQMFERPHHQRIAHVLAALDADALRQHACLFGGGTCIALRYGEYRESVDIDFLVSDAQGYRDVRERVTGPTGINALVRSGAPPLVMLREVRADQYGVRTVVQMDGQAIKFEIVREARIVLKRPQKAMWSAASARSPRSTWRLQNCWPMPTGRQTTAYSAAT